MAGVADMMELRGEKPTWPPLVTDSTTGDGGDEVTQQTVTKSQRKRIEAQTAREPGHYLRHIGPHAVADTWLPSGAWASGDNDEQTSVEALFLAGEQPPEPGWITPATIIEVYDGDTVTVEIVRRFRVRLIDCWCAEIRGKDVDEEQRQRGLNARENLLALLPLNSACTVQIPADHPENDKPLDIGSLTSMSRVMGRVFNARKIDVSQQQVADGHATRTKVK